jgi:hypothetical protein
MVAWGGRDDVEGAGFGCAEVGFDGISGAAGGVCESDVAGIEVLDLVMGREGGAV